MKAFHYLAIISFLLFASCNTQRHNISGVISGLGNDTLVIELIKIEKIADEEIILDTVITTNDKFNYTLSTSGNTLIMINPKKGEYDRLDGSYYWPESNRIVLILSPDQSVKVNGELHDNYLQYNISGSKINKSLAELREEYLEALSKQASIEMKLDSLIYQSGFSKDTRNLFNERAKFRDIQRSKELDYILDNKDSEVSGYLLFFQNLDTIGKYYDELPENVVSGIFKPMLDYKYLRYKKYNIVRNAQENIIPGNKALNFTLKSNSDENVTLSNIDSKFIILDFWGSWCPPCINGLPQMKEYYKKYNGKIEIVGIACNDKEDTWRNAIEKYELDWIHLFNDGDIEKDVSLKYGVEAYPTKIILNSDLEIIGKFEGEGEDFYKKLDELLM